MKRFLAFACVCVACCATLGCGGTTENQVMPEPSAEEEARVMEEEMQQEMEMEDPSMR